MINGRPNGFGFPICGTRYGFHGTIIVPLSRWWKIICWSSWGIIDNCKLLGGSTSFEVAKGLRRVSVFCVVVSYSCQELYPARCSCICLRATLSSYRLSSRSLSNPPACQDQVRMMKHIIRFFDFESEYEETNHFWISHLGPVHFAWFCD